MHDLESFLFLNLNKRAGIPVFYHLISIGAVASKFTFSTSEAVREESLRIKVFTPPPLCKIKNKIKCTTGLERFQVSKQAAKQKGTDNRVGTEENVDTSCQPASG